MATEFDQHFARFGVTQAQFRVLIAIYERGGSEGIAPSVLADHLMLERATVSVLTNRMIERGWLARVGGASRRTFRLTLTLSGAHVLGEVVPHAVSLASTTLAHLSPDEQHHLRTLLMSVETGLRK